MFDGISDIITIKVWKPWASEVPYNNITHILW
jgi:hypothetical protein